MSAHGHILNSYDCCQLKNSSIACTRRQIDRESELRNFYPCFRPRPTPLPPPFISRKIKVNPPPVQLHLRDTVMAHLHTRVQKIRGDELDRAYVCTCVWIYRRYGVYRDFQFHPRCRRCSLSEKGGGGGGGEVRAPLHNFVSIYSRH